MIGNESSALRRQEEENAARQQKRDQEKAAAEAALKWSAQVESSIERMRVTVGDAPDWELEGLERLAVGMMDVVGAEIARRAAKAGL